MPDLRRLRVLLAVLQAADGRTGEGVKTDQVYELVGHELDLDRASLEDILSSLIERQQLQGFESFGGLNDVFLLPAGKEAAQQFQLARADPVARARRLQDHYLRWLYEEEELFDGAPTPDAFLATSPHFGGLPYTAAEVEKAGARLQRDGLIEGPGVDQYAAPLRPRLTAKARSVVEGGRSVHDSIAMASSVQNITTNVHGNANIANASPGAIQTIHVGDWGTQVAEALNAVTQALAVLPADLRGVVTPLIADAREGVAANSPGRVRRALQALAGFLGDSASGALGAALGTQILALLPLLGA